MYLRLGLSAGDNRIRFVFCGNVVACEDGSCLYFSIQSSCWVYAMYNFILITRFFFQSVLLIILELYFTW